MNAILVPSGDQSGWLLALPPEVKMRSPVPSGRTSWILDPMVKAILVPSGDHAGSRSGTPPV